MKLILESWNMFLSEQEWISARDQDFPGGFKGWILHSDGPDFVYNLKGNTHGELSHAIRHVAETNLEIYDEILENIKRIIKEAIEEGSINVYASNKNETLELSLEDVEYFFSKDSRKASHRIVKNTLDFINDKKINGQELSELDELIYNLSDELLTKYKETTQKNLSGEEIPVQGVEKKSYHSSEPDKKGAQATITYGDEIASTFRQPTKSPRERAAWDAARHHMKKIAGKMKVK